MELTPAPQAATTGRLTSGTDTSALQQSFDDAMSQAERASSGAKAETKTGAKKPASSEPLAFDVEGMKAYAASLGTGFVDTLSGKGPMGNFGSISRKGLEFIYAHEHENGKMMDHPSPASGVTIGSGYDMKKKSAATIKADLIEAGASATVAEKLSQGSHLSGAAADAFVRQNKHALDGKGKEFELKLIAHELRDIGHTIDTTVTAKLTQNQRDALMSFIFTIGPEQFAQSKTLAALNRGDAAGAATAMSREFTSSGSLAMAGLATRRKEEAALFRA